MMKIGIIGYGHVGKAMHNLFKNALIYDTNPETNSNLSSKDEINNCDAVFICVPTPQGEDGRCVTTAVEEVISWCNAKVLIIRSTVSIGFTRSMCEKYGKRVVFQPEYYGETVAHPFADLNNRSWLTFGGDPADIDLAISAYHTVVNANTRIYQLTYEEAEMAKYLENAYFAVKVIFCNEAYDLCKSMNINYNQVREAWAGADPRIGLYHTFVYNDNRGYGGSCLPKDVSNIICQANDNNTELSIIYAAHNKNKKYH